MICWRCHKEEAKHVNGYCKSCKKESNREFKLKKNYGLTLDTFQRLVIESGNKCQICLAEFETTPCVDHSHETGEVRGLLCKRCNFGLGHFMDDEELLKNAIKYLRRK